MKREDDFFHSPSGASHWFGVCEARNDPAMMGRIRVRIFGYHSPDRTEIPTETLPWASIMLPTTAAGISGVMATTSSIVEGTWVVGFFRDGISCQDPVVIGSLLGMSSPKWTGLSSSADPKELFPKPVQPSPALTPSASPETAAVIDKIEQDSSQDFFKRIRDSLESILSDKKIEDLRSVNPDLKETPDPVLKETVQKAQDIDEKELEQLKTINPELQKDITSLSPESMSTVRDLNQDQRSILKDFLSARK